MPALRGISEGNPRRVRQPLLLESQLAVVAAAALPPRRYNSPGLSPMLLATRLSLADVCEVLDHANDHPISPYGFRTVS